MDERIREALQARMTKMTVELWELIATMPFDLDADPTFNVDCACADGVMRRLTVGITTDPEVDEEAA